MKDVFGIERTEQELLSWDRLWLETMLGQHGWQPLADWEPYPLAAVPADEIGRPLRTDWIRHHIPVPGAEDILNGGRVLEVGSGPGRIARVAGGRASSYVGLDVSRFAVTVARGRFTTWPHVRFAHIVDDASMDLGGRDLCFAVSVFIHLPPPHAEAALDYLIAQTRAGGWVCVDVYTGGREPAAEWEEHPDGSWRAYPQQADALSLVMKLAGLTHIETVASDEMRSYVIGQKG